MSVKVKIQNLSKSLPSPKYETLGSAGADVMACFDCDTPIKYPNEEGKLVDLEISAKKVLEVYPGDRVLIPTGLKFEIPLGYELQVRPRSGLALKNGITVLNSPGTLDSDYRGMLGVILINHSDADFSIKHGDRIAQIILNKIEQIEFINEQSLSQTERGEGGFGSTGK